MFEGYRAWRKRNVERTERMEQHDWGTIVHLVVNKGGRKWFMGYVYQAMWWFVCLAFFFGAAMGSALYKSPFTLADWISSWWPWMVGAVVVGVLIELTTRSLRDFYRTRREMFGSWFR